MATVLKTVVSKGTVSSNLTASTNWCDAVMVSEQVANLSAALAVSEFESQSHRQLRVLGEMDIMLGFEPSGVGSIPAGPAKNLAR